MLSGMGSWVLWLAVVLLAVAAAGIVAWGVIWILALSD